MALRHQFTPFSIRDTVRLVRLAVKIDHHGVAHCLDFARLGILEALLHPEAGVAHFKDAALAHNRVMEQHGLPEVQIHMNKDILEGQPIDFGLEDMLEVTASPHVEEIALRPVVDMVVRIEVAHADLYRTGKHRLLISSQNAESAAT